MTTLFDGELEVSYGFMLLGPADIESVLKPACAGQVNSLCGAAQPGVLSMVTGTHTGPVPLAVEVLDAEPILGPEWEDVVEVSFSTTVTDLHMQSFDEWEDLSPLPAAGTYRARYSARGMDAANDSVRFADDPPVDRYLLQLWPAPESPDVVVRQGSDVAAYWHQRAQSSPPPVRAESTAADGPEDKRRGLKRASLLRARHEWEPKR